MNCDTSGAPSQRTTAGAAIATLTGNIYLIFGTLVLVTLVVVSWPLSPSGRLGSAIARVWARGLLWSSGVRVEQQRHADLDTRSTYVYMPNHQSQLDIPVLIATLPGQVRFLAKRSLLRIPIFGWGLRMLGFVPVDRDDRSRARDMFEVASRRLAAGLSLVVFPEGTRGPGRHLLPFQRGGFLLALRNRCPVVPVGIQGTSRARPRDSFRNTPTRVVVRYGEPVATAGLTVRDRQALMTRIRDDVAALSGCAAQLEENAQ